MACRHLVSPHPQLQDFSKETQALVLPGSSSKLIVKGGVIAVDPHRQAVASTEGRVLYHRNPPSPGTSGVTAAGGAASAGASRRQPIRQGTWD